MILLHQVLELTMFERLIGNSVYIEFIERYITRIAAMNNNYESHPQSTALASF
jgi:hypothetical protein